MRLGISDNHRSLRDHTLSSAVMYFCLFGLVLLVFAETNRASARKIRVDRLPSGNDQFEVLEDDEKHICTTTEKATEFCAKYGAISVKNTRTCLGLQESLHCRCNSTKSTFLLHEERCVDKENVSRYLRAGMLPGMSIFEYFAI